LTRRRSSSDERRVIVSLTPAGRKLQARAVGIPACIAAAMECSMPEIEALNDKLVMMRNALLRNAA
jgi:DNA-binding MarR family transcriptional regulator